MNYQYQNKSTLLPVINQLPISQTERNLYCQLYGIQSQPQQNQYNLQQFPYQSYPQHNQMTLGYQTNFIPAYQNNPTLPMLQSYQIDPLPFNYNIGKMVHQPGTQIRLEFDLSDFGVPNELPKQPNIVIKQPKKPQPIYKQPEFDYFEQMDVPKIYLSNEQQYRLIRNKIDKSYQPKITEKDLELERLRQLVKQHNLDKTNKGSTEKSPSLKKKSREVSQKKSSAAPKRNYNSPLFTKLKKKVRILVCMQKFIDCYNKTIQSIILKKRELMEKQYKENLKDGNKMLVTSLRHLMGDFQQELVNMTESLQISQGQDKKNVIAKKKIIQLLTLLQLKINGDFNAGTVFTGQLTKVINPLIQSYAFPPKQTYTKLEIKRLPTTHFGSLGTMEANYQKLVLLVFIVVKSMIFTNIYKILDQCKEQITNKDQQLLIQKNAVIIVSIIHEIIIKWIEVNVKEKPNINLDELAKQFKYLDKPLGSDKLQSQKTFPEAMLIEGILPSSLVQKYIVDNNGDREGWVNKFQEDLLAFINNILVQLNKVHKMSVGKKERIVKMMINYNDSL